jgi:hypothetical protein
VAKLTGVRCLSIGRALARTECGLAYAARAITNGKAQDLQMGLNTVRSSIKHVDQMMANSGGATRKILAKVSSMDRDLKRNGKIGRAKAKEMFQSLQDLKLDVDRLFATGAALCPGGKGNK